VPHQPRQSTASLDKTRLVEVRKTTSLVQGGMILGLRPLILSWL
jgi:hypothetical protein